MVKCITNFCNQYQIPPQNLDWELFKIIRDDSI